MSKMRGRGRVPHKRRSAAVGIVSRSVLRFFGSAFSASVVAGAVIQTALSENILLLFTSLFRRLAVASNVGVAAPRPPIFVVRRESGDGVAVFALADVFGLHRIELLDIAPQNNNRRIVVFL